LLTQGKQVCYLAWIASMPRFSEFFR